MHLDVSQMGAGGGDAVGEVRAEGLGDDDFCGGELGLGLRH